MQEEPQSDNEVAITIRIPRELRDRLKELSAKDERSMSSSIRIALRRFAEKAASMVSRAPNVANRLYRGTPHH
jgi:predicted DNA-binding protein